MHGCIGADITSCNFSNNYEEAKEMTKESLQSIFGESKVNGENFTSMYPLEKMSNLETRVTIKPNLTIAEPPMFKVIYMIV
mgnify:CR=1 FL=1